MPDETFSPPGPDLNISATARVLGTDRETVNMLLAHGILKAYELSPRNIRIRRESVIQIRNQILPTGGFEEGGE